MLDLWSNNQAIAARPQPEEGRDLPATGEESFNAAWANGEMFSSSVAQGNARRQALDEFGKQINAAGGDVQSEYASRLTFGLMGDPIEPDGLDVANAALAKAKAKNPALQLNPLTDDDLDKRAVEISRGAQVSYAEMAQREKTFGGKLGGVAGSLASSATDPLNLVLAPIAPEADLGVLGSALLVGGLGAGSQAVNEAMGARYREQVQPGYAASGAPIENIAEAGAGGAVLGGGLKALGNLWTRVKTGEWPTSIRDAGNVIESEGQLQGSNILPGAEGEVAHRQAMGTAVDQILKGQQVDVQIGAASRALMARLESERPFAMPVADMGEIGRISEEAGLRERGAALQTHLEGLPAGDQQAAETLARLQEVERQIPNATGDAKRALSQRRDELLTDTTPEALRAAAAPLEARRQAEGEQASIASRLDEIASERAKAQADRTLAGPQSEPQNIGQTSPVPRTLFDIHEQRIDNMMEMRAQHGTAEPVMRSAYQNGLEGGVKALGHLTGYDMPREEAARLADRVIASKSDDEARAILNEITARPRTIADTVPSAAAIQRAERAAAPGEPPDRPILDALQPDARAQSLADPKNDVALQSELERLIDERAKGSPNAARITFKTAKGSTYEHFPDGTTTRNKAERSDIGHEGDFGPKRRTEKTVYVDNPREASLLSAAGLENVGPKGARVIVKDGVASLMTWNEKEGRWGRVGGEQIPVSSEPGIGKAPLELWKKTDEPEFKGYEAFRSMHAGNEITELTKRETPAQTAMVPIGVDAQGEPIYKSLASALDDIKADRDAATSLESCINPVAEAAE